MSAQCEEFFRATIAAFESASVSASTSASEGKVFDPSKSIRKVVEGGKSVLGAGVMAIGPDGASKEEKRGWDWRRGAGLMRGGGGEVKGESLLRVLRLGLAREVGRSGF